MAVEESKLSGDQLTFDIDTDDVAFASDRVESGCHSVALDTVSGVFYGVDFGANDGLAVHGPDGPIKPPRGGGSEHEKFMRILPMLLNGAPWSGIEAGHVVVESATVGSSGVEPVRVKQIIDATQNQLFTIANRATKNHKKDHGMIWDKGVVVEVSSHAIDAEIIYTIATEHPERLRLWKMPDDSPLQRQHTSVRPYDKRGYVDEQCDRWMSRLPPFVLLPHHLQQFLGNNLGTAKADYSRAKAMPLTMAMDEPGSGTRAGYERILGLYDHGYPSFYRRDTVNLMQDVAKKLDGVTRMEEVSRETRKKAQKITRRNIRQLWHLMMTDGAVSQQGTSDPAKGTVHPVARGSV